MSRQRVTAQSDIRARWDRHLGLQYAATELRHTESDEDVLRDEDGYIGCLNGCERPWGFGYCGTLCEVCAQDAESDGDVERT